MSGQLKMAQKWPVTDNRYDAAAGAVRRLADALSNSRPPPSPIIRRRIHITSCGAATFQLTPAINPPTCPE
jgi:hypothetical protein